MKIIKIDYKKYKKEDLVFVLDYLQRGKVVAYPTDTVYGVGCLANNEAAIRRIHKIKKTKTNKPLILLVNGYCMAKEYCFISKRQVAYLRTVWPRTTQEARSDEIAFKKRPTTVIMRSRVKLPAILVGEGDTLALRLTKGSFLNKLIKRAGFPLVSTSLNLTGNPVIKNVDKLEEQLEEILPDLVIDGGTITKKQSSRLVDIRDIDNIVVIRN